MSASSQEYADLSENSFDRNPRELERMIVINGVVQTGSPSQMKNLSWSDPIVLCNSSCLLYYCK